MSPREELYIILGAVALFFILLITFAIAYDPHGVGGVFIGLFNSIVSPVKAVAYGISGLIVSFFQKIWDSITSVFSNAGSTITGFFGHL